MKFMNPYWGNITKMCLLQRWILVHSVIYYTMDESVVDDAMFDNNSRQLVALQKEHSDLAPRTIYWYVFKDFDGTTGFDLYARLNPQDRKFIETEAHHLLVLGGKYGKTKKGARPRKSNH